MAEAWPRYELGEVVDEAKQRVSPDAVAPDALYVGLEHIEPGVRTVREAGCAADVDSQKSQFEPDDILFGKLRPYLRKVAQADRPGICSTDILVLRPKDDELISADYLYALLTLPELTQYCIDRSAGTRMPRVSAKDLLAFDVPIPSVVIQQRVTDLLAACDAVAEASENHIRSLRSLLSSARAQSLEAATEEAPVVTLGECASISIGRTPPRSNPEYWDSADERPFCTIADMGDGPVLPEREGVSQLAEEEGKAKRVPAGSLLMSFKLTIGRVGFAGRDLFPNEAIAWIEANDQNELDERFLASWLAQYDYSALTGRAVKGATLNSKTLKQISVPLPPLEKQAEVVRLVDAIEKEIAAATRHAQASRDMRDAILQEVVGNEFEIPESYDRFLDDVGQGGE